MSYKPSDQAYRHLFSNPILIRDTIAGFFGSDLADLLDFNCLEPVNPNYISDKLERRSNDMVWRIQWKNRDDWMYLLLIIEFQSERHRFMPVRILSYIGLLYEQLIEVDESIRTRQKLPPVLPLVWHSGQNKWESAISMAALRPANLSATLLKYQPNIEFLLVNEGCYTEDRTDNMAALVCMAKRCKSPEELAKVCKEIDAKLKGPEYRRLRRSFLMLVACICGYDDIENLPAADTLTEVAIMFESLPDRARREGLQQGMQQGRSESLAEGEANIVLRLLKKKFGHLTDHQEALLRAMSTEQLEMISDNIFDAENIDELIYTQSV